MIKTTEMFKDYPDIVTAKEIYTGMLPLSRKVIYELLDNGTIQSMRAGKKILIPKQCVIDYVEKHMSPLGEKVQ